MSSEFEIVIPLHNPTDQFQETIVSLIAQTDRNFSVRMSDNHSETDGDKIQTALAALAAAGIAVSHVRASSPLDAVEHWNWALGDSSAIWLKPLSAGDRLEPNYISRVRSLVQTNSAAQCVFTNYTFLRDGHCVTAGFGWGGHVRAGADVRADFLRDGPVVGPLATAAFHRAAFLGAGGLRPGRWAISQFVFAHTLAATFNAAGLDEPLCHVAADTVRPTRLESLSAACLLAYHAWTENASATRAAIAGLAWRALIGGLALHPK